MRRTTWIVIVGALALVGGLCGCLPEKRVVWSPDGRWATVRAGDGLYLCDPKGKLSPRVAEDVRAVAWLPDSTRLILAREIKAQTWDELANMAPPEWVDRLKAAGEKLRAKILAHEGDFGDFEHQTLEGLNEDAYAAVLLYIRDKRSEGLPEKVGEDWVGLEEVTASVHVLQWAAVKEEGLETGDILTRSPLGIADPRISPDGEKVAFVAADPDRDDLTLLKVMALAEGSTPKLVASYTSMFADWSADGRYLVYAAANSADSARSDSLGLGVIARREVCDEAGDLLEELPEAEDLAGILFRKETKVRCLRDGRVLFATGEVHLPSTTQDMPERPGLFAVDPGRQPVVIPLITRQAAAQLPDGLFFFEVSPDGRRVCVQGGEGALAVLTLATGDVWTLHTDEEADKLRTIPTWRTANELCYNFGPAPGDEGARAEIVLATLDWDETRIKRTVLSQDWPEGAVRGFLIDKEDQPKEAADTDDPEASAAD